MSLSHGRQYLAIPGPSVMPDRVLAAMHRPAPNIYSGELVEMVPVIAAELKAVAQTSGNVAIYICNGHGVWEASLANVAAPGDKVLVAATGMFGLTWANMATTLGLNVETLDFGKRAPIDPARVEEVLAADTAHEIKAVLTTHVDTATSIRTDVKALRDAIDRANHPALLMVDCIASLACDRFEMDAWGVDVMIAGCQKGLMTPPGLAFVFFNEKADAARDALDRVSPYWDWRPRTDPAAFYLYFCGTAPTHHLYGLREALAMIAEEGLENVWSRHQVLAEAVWAAFEHWGQSGPLELNVTDPSLRSWAVTAVRTGTEKASALRQWCEEQAGLTLGIGLGMAPPDAPEWHTFFRVGHMGHTNPHMVLGAVATIEAGLKAVEIQHHGGGAEAAASVIAAKTGG
ncbi:MAG: aminotransferase class V-fold PLP-dependent enzyme [Pseudomonadota bacterium]